MSWWAELRAAEQNWRTDDAPLWAEVLAAVLPIGLTVRNGVHVYTALFARAHSSDTISPELAASDVTVRSPVEGVRERLRVDAAARYFTCVAGLAGWYLLTPFSDSMHPAIQLFYALNVAVCVADPVLFGVDRVRQFVQDFDQPMIDSNQPDDGSGSDSAAANGRAD